MKFRVNVTESAQKQIEQAYLRYKNDFSSLADPWLEGLFKVLDTLKQFPNRCPLAPENDELEEKVRQLLYGKRKNTYRILFTVRGKTVEVLHVRHHAQARLTSQESEDENLPSEDSLPG